ncbi:hypothetical protein BJX96DRAFT_147358 [Aspergillus floccosus]
MPSNCSTEYNTLDLWVYVAKMTEKAKMDGVFSADMLRLYKTQGNDWSDIARLSGLSCKHIPSIFPRCLNNGPSL